MKNLEEFAGRGQAAQKAVDLVMQAVAAPKRVTLDEMAAAMTEIKRAERRVKTQGLRLQQQEARLEAAVQTHAKLAAQYAAQDPVGR